MTDSYNIQKHIAKVKTENMAIVAVFIADASEVVCLATPALEDDEEELVKLVVAFLWPYAEVLATAALEVLVFIVVEFAE